MARPIRLLLAWHLKMNKIAEEKNKKEIAENKVKEERSSPSNPPKDLEDSAQEKPSKGSEEESKQVSESKEEKKPPIKKSVAPNTVVEGSGINLIPTMSEEELDTEEKKKKINATSLISVSLLLSISILVIGFNIVSKIQLNAQQEKLNEQEREIQGYSQLISGNTEILERVFLYEDIQGGRFSTKLVIDHFRNQVSKSGASSLEDFSFPGTKSFEFSGRGQNLEDVSKLWYLLINDKKVETVELKSVSKSLEGAIFSFNGTLVIEEFMGLSDNE